MDEMTSGVQPQSGVYNLKASTCLTAEERRRAGIGGSVVYELDPTVRQPAGLSSDLSRRTLAPPILKSSRSRALCLIWKHALTAQFDRVY